MASGLVVFMTPVKAAESLVENGKTGFIAPDYSAESIAKLIISATNKPSKLAQISRNARKFSSNFSAEKMTKSYLRLFIKLSK